MQTACHYVGQGVPVVWTGCPDYVASRASKNTDSSTEIETKILNADYYPDL